MDRVNDETATARARRQKLVDSLGFDERCVYCVAVAHAVLERLGPNTEPFEVPHCVSNPEREALAEQFMRTIKQANDRFVELERDGRIPVTVERLEELGLLPVWIA